jgi:hypothetical protein
MQKMISNIKKASLIILLPALIMLSCNQNQDKKSTTSKEEEAASTQIETPDSISAIITKLDQQIMVTHDEVMPKIGLVLSLRRNINAKIDSCPNKACKEALQEISYALTKADADMMQWMRTYQTPQGKDTAIQYLENQQKEITRVKSQILQSIQSAKKAVSY